MNRRKGFTLIELLVVVAIIALLISILLPSLSRARELAKRTVCASNENGIGKALYIYANDNYEWFPHHYYNNPTPPNTVPATSGITYITKMGSNNTLSIAQQTAGPSTALPGGYSPLVSNPSRSLFLLIVGGQSTTGSFICPSAGDQDDDLRNRGNDAGGAAESAAQPGKNRFDFRGYPNLSYGYQMPYGRKGKPNLKLDTRMPVSADKSPYFSQGTTDANTQTTHDARSGITVPTSFGTVPADILRRSNDDWRPYNSQNHNGEGQTVLFTDGHAEFKRRPIEGVTNDNIYTVMATYNNQVDSLIGVAPTGDGDTFCPLTQTDSFIVP